MVQFHGPNEALRRGRRDWHGWRIRLLLLLLGDGEQLVLRGLVDLKMVVTRIVMVMLAPLGFRGR